MTVEIFGYRFSVYAWIARLALAEKGVEFRWNEIDPFERPIAADYVALNPFGRVPTLKHAGFVLYETCAITRYIDEAFDGPALQPSDPRRRARCAQICSIADSYAYVPLVRQVFAHSVFRPRSGAVGDPDQVASGLAAAPTVIGALEALTGEGPFLVGDELTLADLHLGPMIGYFTLAPEGAELIGNYPRIRHWLVSMSTRPAFQRTVPDLDALQ